MSRAPGEGGRVRLIHAAPDTLVALRRLVGEDQFPQVFSALTPAPDIASATPPNT